MMSIQHEWNMNFKAIETFCSNVNLVVVLEGKLGGHQSQRDSTSWDLTVNIFLWQSIL